MLGLMERLFSIIQQLRQVEIATSAVLRQLLIGVIALCKFLIHNALSITDLIVYHLYKQPIPPLASLRWRLSWYMLSLL